MNVEGVRLLTTRELAERLGYSYDQVLRWANAGLIPAIRISGTKHGRLRFDLFEVERILRERSAAALEECPSPDAQPPAADDTLPRSVTPPTRSKRRR
jgi:excisionase family DNA binding protein